MKVQCPNGHSSQCAVYSHPTWSLRMFQVTIRPINAIVAFITENWEDQSLYWATTSAACAISRSHWKFLRSNFESDVMSDCLRFARAPNASSAPTVSCLGATDAVSTFMRQAHAHGYHYFPWCPWPSQYLCECAPSTCSSFGAPIFTTLTHLSAGLGSKKVSFPNPATRREFLTSDSVLRSTKS